MGYHDHDEDEAVVRTGGGALGIFQGIVAILVRLLGMGLILVGLGVGIAVVLEAWALYQSPERIARFAVAIEEGSNIDSAFSSIAGKAASEAAGEDGRAQPDSSTAAAAVQGTGKGGFRVSYFAAWVIVLALMLVVGILSMSAASTGARLALSYGGSGRR